MGTPPPPSTPTPGSSLHRRYTKRTQFQRRAEIIVHGTSRLTRGISTWWTLHTRRAGELGSNLDNLGRQRLCISSNAHAPTRGGGLSNRASNESEEPCLHLPQVDGSAMAVHSAGTKAIGVVFVLADDVFQRHGHLLSASEERTRLELRSVPSTSKATLSPFACDRTPLQ